MLLLFVVASISFVSSSESQHAKFALVNVHTGSRIAAQKGKTWHEGLLAVDRGQFNSDQFWLIQNVDEQDVAWQKVTSKGCMWSHGEKYTDLALAQEACTVAGPTCCGVRADGGACKRHGCFLCTACESEALLERGAKDKCFYRKIVGERSVQSYVITNVHSGRNLHGRTGTSFYNDKRAAAVTGDPKEVNDMQKWVLERLKEGSYLIRNVANGKLLMHQKMHNRIVMSEQGPTRDDAKEWLLMRINDVLHAAPDATATTQCAWGVQHSTAEAVSAAASAAGIKALETGLLSAKTTVQMQERRISDFSLDVEALRAELNATRMELGHLRSRVMFFQLFSSSVMLTLLFICILGAMWMQQTLGDPFARAQSSNDHASTKSTQSELGQISFDSGDQKEFQHIRDSVDCSFREPLEIVQATENSSRRASPPCSDAEIFQITRSHEQDGVLECQDSDASSGSWEALEEWPQTWKCD